MNLKKSLMLYVVSSSKYGEEVKTLTEAMEGGATAVQLRMKGVSDREFYEKAKILRKKTEDYDVLFIVDDRIDIALAVNADGVHLGAEDLPLQVAREIAPEIIIGKTVRNEKDAVLAETEGADYLGAGSVFPSNTKKAEVIGLSELQNIVDSVRIPVVAIGGINEGNACEVMRTGVAGLAVSQGVLEGKTREKTEKMKLTLRNCR